jgi:hypothetical protein
VARSDVRPTPRIDPQAVKKQDAACRSSFGGGLRRTPLLERPVRQRYGVLQQTAEI